MVAEQRDDDMADKSKRSPGSSRRSRRETKPITQEKINQETVHTKRMHRTELEKETQQVDGWVGRPIQ